MSSDRWFGAPTWLSLFYSGVGLVSAVVGFVGTVPGFAFVLLGTLAIITGRLAAGLFALFLGLPFIFLGRQLRGQGARKLRQARQLWYTFRPQEDGLRIRSFFGSFLIPWSDVLHLAGNERNGYRVTFRTDEEKQFLELSPSIVEVGRLVDALLELAPGLEGYRISERGIRWVEPPKKQAEPK